MFVHLNPLNKTLTYIRECGEKAAKERRKRDRETS
jgi:hypothetical protein